MFETATLSYGPSGKRVWTTAMGFTGQALLVACALLAPMISPQVLPRVTWLTTIAPPGPPPGPPPPREASVPRTGRVVPATVRATGIFVPPSIPNHVTMLVDDEAPAVAGGPYVPGAVPYGKGDGAPGGIPFGIAEALGRSVPTVKPPEPKPPAAATTHVAPPRITVLKMATPIHRVDPIYPPLAKQARVSGTVELLGVLGTDGRIHELKVLHGHPLLVKAAMDAVLQWTYEPTVLNGQAVEVSAPIVVNFILNQ
ncbi:MAG: TonB family protein [Candidatus Solibacter sp.]|nr:TonB family protein [Candidatus Solibacter sp.]